ncbi:hypothetical protein SSX86_019723 [Deinandra increscens subsp. villosa]|uniref:Uncharacterized protein n=1 Tax=Deinandra increscens subsp. villosa TaxID=3103831 RepID=A0AAP0GUT9_9ASTR
MARLTIITLVIVAILVCGAPCLDARKLLSDEKKGSIMEGSLVKSGLGKPSGLSDEKLFALHLARIDRILVVSTPSPGAGN